MYQALRLSTGNGNTAVGWKCLSTLTTGQYNTAVGDNQQVANFSSCIMLGVGDTATANGELRFGSTAVPLNAVTAQVNASSQYLPIFINGVSYKMLLA